MYPHRKYEKCVFLHSVSQLLVFLEKSDQCIIVEHGDIVKERLGWNTWTKACTNGQ